MSEWKDIATAPNNVVIITDGSWCGVAVPVDGKWFAGWVHEDGSSYRQRFYPTHWMDLPPPPPALPSLPEQP
jgi:hypothetical protein